MSDITIQAEIPRRTLNLLLLSGKVAITLSSDFVEWTASGDVIASESSRGYSQLHLANGDVEIEPEPTVNWKIVLEGTTFAPAMESALPTRRKLQDPED